MFKTFFASPERKARNEIIEIADRLNQDVVISEIMKLSAGLVAVLSEDRQILALNDAFLHQLGITDPAAALGLRPGEVLDCIHSQVMPAGCGTSMYCATCGAAIAMVSALADNTPTEQGCCITVSEKGQENRELFFNIRCTPAQIRGQRFLLLFLQDITRQQQLASLERVFFHDLNNIISAVVGKSELIAFEADSGNKDRIASEIVDLAVRLAREVDIQRTLLKDGTGKYAPLIIRIPLTKLFHELQEFIQGHPAARGKKVEIQPPSEEISFNSDFSLITRILSNMIINALEATELGGKVKLSYSCPNKGVISFSVWNAGVIPEKQALRIFQRNYSTKTGEGRGLGTFSMKLFGEAILGGKVSFISDEKTGTVFNFILPTGMKE